MPTDKETSEPEPDLREIGAWSRRYAQNRTVPMAASIVISILLMGAIWGVSYLVGLASGKPSGRWAKLGSWQEMATFMLLVLGLAWFGRKWRPEQWISARIYRAEGEATVGGGVKPSRAVLKALAFVAGGGLGAAMVLSMRLPLHYMQPVAAAIIVPALVLRLIITRAGVFSYLWPGLYAVQAILILLGMPLYLHFSRLLWIFNMLIPFVAYGLVAALAGHIYSRVALRNLRRLASVTPEEAQEP
jgi:hypothetical protein